uniref:hypothetical protein n=1 Tax=Thaumasiovibrio occultus TaxID=1891184 RepID=UPI000B35C7E2|nr:hypothetical protein [Thaumasiovibrio occultus]
MKRFVIASLFTLATTGAIASTEFDSADQLTASQRSNGLSLGMGHAISGQGLGDANENTSVSFNVNYLFDNQLIIGLSYIPTLANHSGSEIKDNNYYSYSFESRAITPYVGFKFDNGWMANAGLSFIDAKIVAWGPVEPIANVEDNDVGFSFGAGYEWRNRFSMNVQTSLIDFHGLDGINTNLYFGYRY